MSPDKTVVYKTLYTLPDVVAVVGGLAFGVYIVVYTLLAVMRFF